MCVYNFCILILLLPPKALAFCLSFCTLIIASPVSPPVFIFLINVEFGVVRDGKILSTYLVLLPNRARDRDEALLIRPTQLVPISC